nr:hypothetical protein [Actinomadura sp. CNU-125]
MRTHVRAQPSATRAACASGTPMNTSGAASARQARSAGCGSARSTSTGTAPIRSSAWTSATISTPGWTITDARVPARTPAVRRPAAVRSMTAASSANVTARGVRPPVTHATASGRVRTWHSSSAAR